MSPVRTCIGCRKRADKADLLRLVWRGTLVTDDRQIEPGRGAYLHRSAECLQAAVRRRSIGRALRVSNSNLHQIDPAAIVGSLA